MSCPSEPAISPMPLRSSTMTATLLAAARASADGSVQGLQRVVAVGQAGQGVVPRLVGDARLAARDVFLHGIEGHRELRELVAGGDGDRTAVVADLHALRGLGELLHRFREGARQQHRARQRQQQRQGAQDDRRRLQQPVRRHGLVQRFAEKDFEARRIRNEGSRDDEVVLAVDIERVRVAWRTRARHRRPSRCAAARRGSSRPRPAHRSSCARIVACRPVTSSRRRT